MDEIVRHFMSIPNEAKNEWAETKQMVDWIMVGLRRS